eukprot:355404-Chlamydomonas_euryale.AAC.3
MKRSKVMHCGSCPCCSTGRRCTAAPIHTGRRLPLSMRACWASVRALTLDAMEHVDANGRREWSPAAAVEAGVWACVRALARRHRARPHGHLGVDGGRGADSQRRAPASPALAAASVRCTAVQRGEGSLWPGFSYFPSRFISPSTSSGDENPEKRTAFSLCILYPFFLVSLPALLSSSPSLSLFPLPPLPFLVLVFLSSPCTPFPTSYDNCFTSCKKFPLPLQTPEGVKLDLSPDLSRIITELILVVLSPL